LASATASRTAGAAPVKATGSKAVVIPKPFRSGGLERVSEPCPSLVRALSEPLPREGPPRPSGTPPEEGNTPSFITAQEANLPRHRPLSWEGLATRMHEGPRHWSACQRGSQPRRGPPTGPERMRLMQEQNCLARNRNSLGVYRNSSGSNRSPFGTDRNSFGGNRNSFGANRSLSGTIRDSFGANRNLFGASRNLFGSSRNRLGIKKSASDPPL